MAVQADNFKQHRMCPERSHVQYFSAVAQFDISASKGDGKVCVSFL